jgi:hypothetical protein
MQDYATDLTVLVTQCRQLPVLIGWSMGARERKLIHDTYTVWVYTGQDSRAAEDTQIQ